MARRCVHDREARRCSQCEPQQVFEFYQKQATERGLEFKLTYQQFVDVIAQVCHFCGRYDIPRGLDRKNNAVGYVTGNVLPCCWPCNKFKAGMDYFDFSSMCDRVVQYQKSRKQKAA